MKVLLVDDNVTPFPVEPSNGTTPIQCTPGTVPGGSGPIVLNGGDTTQASTPVGDGASATVQTLSIDTTGLGIGAAIVWATGTVALTAAATGTVTIEVLLDDNSLSPPIGNLLVAADGTTLAYSMSGIIPLTEGAHTIKVRATTESGTTAVVNPSRGELGALSSNVTLLFLAA